MPFGTVQLRRSTSHEQPTRSAVAGAPIVHAGRVIRAFTIVEVLVSISILAVLVALLLPAVRGAIVASRGFKCQSAQRSVAFSFSIFADENLTVDRGNYDNAMSGFSLENFIESQYQIDEFWGYDGDTQIDLPDANGNDPLRCPEVKGPIRLRRQGCRRGGITPPQNVSFGFNMRMDVAEVSIGNDGWTAQQIRLGSDILNNPLIPLMWDVDGQVADDKGVSPLFSAPALDSPSVFANDQYWFPAMRHDGKANFTFIDGHVAESSKPLLEHDWRWQYRSRTPSP